VGGILDQFPTMRVAFLEAGCQWIHFMTERARTPFQAFPGLPFDNPQRNLPKAKLSPTEYLKQGNLYFSAEAEDVLLPQVIELVGETQMVFGTDMPHGDRERFAGRELAKRKDISDSANARDESAPTVWVEIIPRGERADGQRISNSSIV
jgi:uncharacterized protein